MTRVGVNGELAMDNELTAGVLRSIRTIRGQRVILDRDLAKLYGCSTSALNQAVRRNLDRFPDDFMFRLTDEEVLGLQGDGLRSQNVTLKRGQHLKYPPLAFTELGIAMLSSVLNTERAIQVNISIMRVFVKLRVVMAEHRELSRKVEPMEVKYDALFEHVFDQLRDLNEPPTSQIGFHAD
jgi:hypothetical protein